MDKVKKFVNVTYDDRGRRQFELKPSSAEEQKTVTPTTPIVPPIDYSKPLQARTEDIDLTANLGRRKLAPDEDIAKTAPFHCPACDFSVMDSNSWLDHLNSQTHNRRVGNHMKVEKVSVERVRARLQMLKNRQKPEIITAEEAHERAVQEYQDHVQRKTVEKLIKKRKYRSEDT